jgi:hypothetical protein
MRPASIDIATPQNAVQCDGIRERTLGRALALGCLGGLGRGGAGAGGRGKLMGQRRKLGQALARVEVQVLALRRGG